MKTLYYNSIELPAEVHIVSHCFGIDITYEPMGDPNHPAWLDELFNLAKCDSFEEVSVCLTAHNEAYTRTSKSGDKESVNGWVSLKGLKNGGGYFNDRGF
jgi:hypothetical protein